MHYYKVEFLFRDASRNLPVARGVMGWVYKTLLENKEAAKDIRLCMEGNVDSWSYLYVRSYIQEPRELRTALEKELPEIKHMGVSIGMVYDIAVDKVITPMGRTIKEVFSDTTLAVVAAAATKLWAELLVGEPHVTVGENGEVVIRLRGVTTRDGKLLNWSP